MVNQRFSAKHLYHIYNSELCFRPRTKAKQDFGPEFDTLKTNQGYEIWVLTIKECPGVEVLYFWHCSSYSIQ